MTKQSKKTDLEERIVELESQLKRSLADYQNLERRISNEKDQLSKFGITILITKILPVLDNLKKAVNHISDSGLNMVLSQMEQVLTSEGVEEIKIEKGSIFDPKIAEAIEVINGKKDNQVAEVLKTGYTISGKLLRPAQVKVFKSKVENSNVEQKETSQFGDYA
jgi:molecular chaperone GrpE